MKFFLNAQLFSLIPFSYIMLIGVLSGIHFGSFAQAEDKKPTQALASPTTNKNLDETPSSKIILEPPKPQVAKQAAPSAPPSFSQRQTIDSYKCQREVFYQGKLLQCDSQLAKDGQNLRPILSKTPLAIRELDIYQANRKRFNDLAYVGSFGIGLWWLGNIIANRLDSSTPENEVRNKKIKNRTYHAGLAITGLSFSFGIFSLHNNEKHLQKAIDIHNKTHPEDRLEIRFSTSFSF